MKEEIKNWKDKRINAINRKLKKFPCRELHEYYSDEVYRIYNSQASNKEEYKAQNEHCCKFTTLTYLG
tara:strand:- start:1316 stop:1519 length:204 start_codon:yes stop_codon:yes gene_type:complete